MIITFWVLLLLIVYCYFGYPLLISILSRIAAKPVRRGQAAPAVSILISIWNEEEVIRQKIENLCSIHYPADQFEILIGSDGSTDKSDEIIKNFGDPRVRLVQSDRRRGKMAMLNQLVDKAAHDILVFTDARQIFAPDAVQILVNNLQDPAVGCVSGELIFSRKEGATAKGINLYWNYEKFIRRKESDVHSMLGATGAIYAIRKGLYANVPENVVLDDMYIPLKIIQKGYRAVFDPSAKAFDEVSDSPREEHRRKARTLFGNYQIFWIFKAMFIPLYSPIAFQLFSHKLLRVLIPFFMIAIFVINGALLSSPLYVTMFYLQVIFYLMALTGSLARHQKYGIFRVIAKTCYVPYVFCLLNFSALIGFVRFTFTKQEATWTKAKE